MNQVERIIKILRLLSGLSRYSAKEIRTRIGAETSIRTIQRDLREIEACGLRLESVAEANGEVTYILSREDRRIAPPQITQNELLSFYLLKAYLSAFRGTPVQKEVGALTKKLEALAPGDVYLPIEYDDGGSELIWDQDFGQYDYSRRPELLTQVIDTIRAGKVVHVHYRRPDADKDSGFDVAMHRLFSYKGSIYVACYMPFYEHEIALAIQGIRAIKASTHEYTQSFPFDQKKFVANRFGVFSGDLANVTLRIQKAFAPYFKHRSWHRTQKLTTQPNGDLLLEMRVPLSPELVSWIVGWGEAMRVTKPASLRALVKAHLTATLKLYR